MRNKLNKLKHLCEFLLYLVGVGRVLKGQINRVLRKDYEQIIPYLFLDISLNSIV